MALQEDCDVASVTSVSGEQETTEENEANNSKGSTPDVVKDYHRLSPVDGDVDGHESDRTSPTDILTSQAENQSSI